MPIKIGAKGVSLPGVAKVMRGDKQVWSGVPPWVDLEFIYTGAAQDVDLPAGTYLLKLWGAQGGIGAYSDNLGGEGGYAEGKITLPEPTTLRIYVGGAGVLWANAGAGGGGGWNGGGDAPAGLSWYRAGSGGGASDIRIGGTALTDRVIVAGGGGGGAGYTSGITGGAGGGTSGLQGVVSSGSNWSGTGGTQAAGGATGGALGTGGASTAGSSGRGGGGGGYYGGGHAQANYYGGGGGSSYIAHEDISEGSTTAGQRSGNGLVQIQKLS